MEPHPHVLHTQVLVRHALHVAVGIFARRRHSGSWAASITTAGVAVAKTSSFSSHERHAHTHTHAHRTQVHSPHPPRNQAPMMLATAPRWSIRGRQPQRMPSLAMQVPITLPTESVCFGACSTDMVTRERCEWKWLKGLGRTRQGWRLKHREGSTKHGCTTVNPTIRAMGRYGKHTVGHHGCRVDGWCSTHLVGRSGHKQVAHITSPKLGTTEKDANYDTRNTKGSFFVNRASKKRALSAAQGLLASSLQRKSEISSLLDTTTSTVLLQALHKSHQKQKLNTRKL
jgi:hypothetical protein